MLYNFYLFITPLVIVCAYVSVKYFLNRGALANMENNAFSAEDGELTNNLEEAKEKVFVFFDGMKNSSFRWVIIFFHWVLHFFVIFLGFMSDLIDALYASARDFFLKTAAKEKGAVSTFWHHLKEYKKEKEDEKNN